MWGDILLNLKQKKAVIASDRFIFLLAGAGTGKTTVIINKVKRLLEKGVKAENVLVLSFTRKSVYDLKRRFEDFDLPFITTFHGFCYNELSAEYNVNIVEEPFLIQEGFSKEELTAIDNFKRNNKTNKLVDEYNTFLDTNNFFDYTDLEYILIDKLKRDKLYLNNISKTYKYIFVDEFQDTSLVQFELLKLLSKEALQVFCVGDPNQSIYSFRGASKEVINKYLKEFNAQTYLLNENYRSGSNILNISNNLIKYNSDYFKFDLISKVGFDDEVVLKYFIDEIMQADFIISEIRKLLEEDFYQTEIAVIYRNHYLGNIVKQKLEETYFEKINTLTIHQAKGLEFDCVFIIGLEENNLPFMNADIEEERRLFYVAVTRARKRLYLLVNLNKNKASRFIFECFK